MAIFRHFFGRIPVKGGILRLEVKISEKVSEITEKLAETSEKVSEITEKLAEISKRIRSARALEA